MAIDTFTLDDKIAALEIEIKETRKARRDPGSAMQRHYEILKSIASDLRARQGLPRSNPLGEIERQMVSVQYSKTALGYDSGRMVSLAQAVISKWHFVRQALEHFGEESAE